MKNQNPLGVMLNAYPDSLGGKLGDIVSVMQRPELKGAFTSFYILPSVFNTDLDRGFSLIDYNLNHLLASSDDLDRLIAMGVDLALDFILNHISVLSNEFQDILKHGDASPYCDFFIDWNRFWEGHGEITPQGYIQPDANLIENMFFRKPGLPILMVRFPDGRDVPYWNTFYQHIQYGHVDPQELMQITGAQYGEAAKLAELVNHALDEGKTPLQIDFQELEHFGFTVRNYLEKNRKYLGQMDLNIKSPLVWEYYHRVLKKLAQYGATIVRLDAFAYAPKEVGARNFLNDPGTWQLLERIEEIAKPFGLTLLPEIHASYEDKIYDILGSKGYLVYDFFLPGLIIDAFERHSGVYLVRWINEISEKKLHTVNMLGCHDGIPLLDLKGMLDQNSIESLINTVVSRGGWVKNLHGQKNLYYQVNATYYSALGEDDRRMLLARAIQMFMPGKPQVWYLDLFVGKNDYAAMARAGKDGHKEINRTNLSAQEIQQGLQKQIVLDQLKLLQMRNRFPVFGENAVISAWASGSCLSITWESENETAHLTADLAALTFTADVQQGGNSETSFHFAQI